MLINEAFSVLNIEPTDDIKIVKKAYASEVKKYHPEENPEEWQKIHDAYIELKKYIEHKNQNQKNTNIILDAIEIDADLKNNDFAGDNVAVDDIENVEADEENNYELDDETRHELDSFIDNGYSTFKKSKDAFGIDKYNKIIGRLKYIHKNVKENYNHFLSYASYNTLKNNPLYKEALGYVPFIEQLIQVLDEAIVETALLEIIEKDVVYAMDDYPEYKELYDNILNILRRKNIKKEIYRERSNNTDNFGGYNTSTRRSENYIFARILILMSIIIIITISRCSLADNKNDAVDKLRNEQIKQAITQGNLDIVSQSMNETLDIVLDLYAKKERENLKVTSYVSESISDDGIVVSLGTGPNLEARKYSNEDDGYDIKFDEYLSYLSMAVYTDKYDSNKHNIQLYDKYLNDGIFFAECDEKQKEFLSTSILSEKYSKDKLMEFYASRDPNTYHDKDLKMLCEEIDKMIECGKDYDVITAIFTYKYYHNITYSAMKRSEESFQN